MTPYDITLHRKKILSCSKRAFPSIWNRKTGIIRKWHFIPSGKGSPVSAATFAGMNTWYVRQMLSLPIGTSYRKGEHSTRWARRWKAKSRLSTFMKGWNSGYLYWDGKAKCESRLSHFASVHFTRFMYCLLLRTGRYVWHRKGTPISHRHAFWNYDSKKKQLNEFIYIKCLCLIFCIIHCCSMWVITKHTINKMSYLLFDSGFSPHKSGNFFFG